MESQNSITDSLKKEVAVMGEVLAPSNANAPGPVTARTSDEKPATVSEPTNSEFTPVVSKRAQKVAKAKSKQRVQGEKKGIKLVVPTVVKPKPKPAKLVTKTAKGTETKAKRRRERANARAARVMVVDITDFPKLAKAPENKVYSVWEAKSFLAALNVAPPPQAVVEKKRKEKSNLTKVQTRELKAFGKVITKYDPVSGAILQTSDRFGNVVIPQKKEKKKKDVASFDENGNPLNRKARRLLKSQAAASASSSTAPSKTPPVKVLGVKEAVDTVKSLLKTKPEGKGKITPKAVSNAHVQIPSIASDLRRYEDWITTELKCDDPDWLKYYNGFKPTALYKAPLVDRFLFHAQVCAGLYVKSYEPDFTINVWPHIKHANIYWYKGYSKTMFAPSTSQYSDERTTYACTEWPTGNIKLTGHVVFIGVSEYNDELLKFINSIVSQGLKVDLLIPNPATMQPVNKEHYQMPGSTMIVNIPNRFLKDKIAVPTGLMSSKQLNVAFSSINSLFMLATFNPSAPKPIKASVFSQPQEVLVGARPHYELEGDITPSVLVEKTTLNMMGRDISPENFQLTLKTAGRIAREHLEDGDMVSSDDAILAARISWHKLRNQYWYKLPWSICQAIFSPYTSINLLAGEPQHVYTMLGVGLGFVLLSTRQAKPGMLMSLYDTYFNVVNHDWKPFDPVKDYLSKYNEMQIAVGEFLAKGDRLSRFFNWVYDVNEYLIITMAPIAKRLGATETPETMHNGKMVPVDWFNLSHRMDMWLTSVHSVMIAPVYEEMVKRIHPYVGYAFIAVEACAKYFTGCEPKNIVLVAAMHLVTMNSPYVVGVAIHSLWNAVAMGRAIIAAKTSSEAVRDYAGNLFGRYFPFAVITTAIASGRDMPGVFFEEYIKKNYTYGCLAIVGFETFRVYNSGLSLTLSIPPALVHFTTMFLDMEDALLIHALWNIYVDYCNNSGIFKRLR